MGGLPNGSFPRCHISSTESVERQLDWAHVGCTSFVSIADASGKRGAIARASVLFMQSQGRGMQPRLRCTPAHLCTAVTWHCQWDLCSIATHLLIGSPLQSGQGKAYTTADGVGGDTAQPGLPWQHGGSDIEPETVQAAVAPGDTAKLQGYEELVKVWCMGTHQVCQRDIKDAGMLSLQGSNQDLVCLAVTNKIFSVHAGTNSGALCSLYLCRRLLSSPDAA